MMWQWDPSHCIMYLTMRCDSQCGVSCNVVCRMIKCISGWCISLTFRCISQCNVSHSDMYLTMGGVPDTASYIRGWIQMVLAPNDLFSWNNKYSKYTNIYIATTFTFISSCAHQLTLCMLASWSREGVVFLVLLSSSHLTTYHVLSLSLSGLNWRSLFPPLRTGSPFPQDGAPIHRVRAHPLTGVHDRVYLTIWCI
jgi:hypothetical protein